MNLGEVLFVPVIVDGLGHWRVLLHFGDGGEIALVLGAGIKVWNQGEGCLMILGVGLFHLVIEVEGLIQEHGHYAFEGFFVPI